MTSEHPIDREVNVRWVLGLALGILMLTVLSGALGWLLFWSKGNALVERDPPPRPVSEAPSRRLPEGPRLQARPAAELVALRAAQSKLLESYGPIDAGSNTARIPLRRAMDLYVSKSMRAARPAGAEEQGDKP